VALAAFPGLEVRSGPCASHTRARAGLKQGGRSERMAKVGSSSSFTPPDELLHQSSRLSSSNGWPP
jgi:hypothetical protein